MGLTTVIIHVQLDFFPLFFFTTFISLIVVITKNPLWSLFFPYLFRFSFLILASVFFLVRMAWARRLGYDMAWTKANDRTDSMWCVYWWYLVSVRHRLGISSNPRLFPTPMFFFRIRLFPFLFTCRFHDSLSSARFCSISPLFSVC